MLGLLKSNFYAAQSGAKWLFIIVLVFGTVVIILGNDVPLIIFTVLCIIGFSVNAIASLRKEGVLKWNEYKLAMPVRRSDIVKSQFLSQVIWTLAAMVPVGIYIGLSMMLHGFLFDVKNIAIIFFTGISISLFMGAIFYPLFLIGGAEKNEIALGISFIGAICIFAGFVYLLNLAFDFEMQTWQVFFCMAVVLAAAVLAFILSYFTTVAIFQKKEY